MDRRTAIARTVLVVAALAGVGVAAMPARSTAPREAASEQLTARCELRLQSYYPRGVPGLGGIPVALAQRIESVTGGELAVKVADPGAYVQPREILEAVAAGGVEAGFATAGFWQGKLPAGPLFRAVPFGPDAGEYLAWFMRGNGASLHQELYDRAGLRVKVLVAAVTAPETAGWFRREITRPDDLHGLKMRFFGLGGDVMAKLGVAVSKQPPGEIFEALDRGVLDATEFASPAADVDIGLHRVAKYNYFPGWHQQATVFELLINRAVWDALPARHRAAIEAACAASVAESYAASEALQGRAVRENAERRGVVNKVWSAEMLALFERTWREVAAEHCARDPFFRKVWEDLEAFRAEYRHWGALGFLPRGRAP